MAVSIPRPAAFSSAAISRSMVVRANDCGLAAVAGQLHIGDNVPSFGSLNEDCPYLPFGIVPLLDWIPTFELHEAAPPMNRFAAACSNGVLRLAGWGGTLPNQPHGSPAVCCLSSSRRGFEEGRRIVAGDLSL